MNDWKTFLAARGARIEEAGVETFGDLASELQAAADGSVVVPLLHLGVLTFAGADAVAFLHSQLSCDVKGLAAGGSTWGSYCTPKGRMLATFFLLKEPGAIALLPASDVCDSLRKRLAMFILRSKVTVSDATSELALLGVSGPGGSDALLEALGMAPPATAHRGVWSTQGIAAVRLPGRERYLVLAPPAETDRVWGLLAQRLRPAGAAAWQWLDIVHGVPLVTALTQEAFVPQMVNLELVGGVSFDKGCYPGQEIVARTQHLGQVKRRMHLAHVDTGIPPSPAAPLYHESDALQTAGMVVNASPAPGGGVDLLAVVQTSALAGGAVRLGTPDGPVLAFRPLPYAIP